MKNKEFPDQFLKETIKLFKKEEMSFEEILALIDYLNTFFTAEYKKAVLVQSIKKEKVEEKKDET